MDFAGVPTSNGDQYRPQLIAQDLIATADREKRAWRRLAVVYKRQFRAVKQAYMRDRTAYVRRQHRLTRALEDLVDAEEVLERALDEQDDLRRQLREQEVQARELRQAIARELEEQIALERQQEDNTHRPMVIHSREAPASSNLGVDQTPTAQEPNTSSSSERGQRTVTQSPVGWAPVQAGGLRTPPAFAHQNFGAFPLRIDDFSEEELDDIILMQPMGVTPMLSEGEYEPDNQIQPPGPIPMLSEGEYEPENPIESLSEREHEDL